MVNLESRGTRIAISSLIVIIILLVFGASLATLSNFGLPKASGYKGTIKIGCITFPKGSLYYEESQEIKRGLELWADHANEHGIKVSGATYKVQIVCRESPEDPTQLRLTVFNLIKNDKVNFIVAPPGNTYTGIVLEVTENQHVPTILTYADNDYLFRNGGQYAFMLMTPRYTQISSVLKMLGKYHIIHKYIAILYESTTTGDTKSWANGLMGALRTPNITITFHHSFTKDNASTVIGDMVNLKANQNIVFVIAASKQGLEAAINALYTNKVHISTLKHIIVIAPGETMKQAEEDLGVKLDRVIYISMWEPIAPISPFMAANLGLEWYGYTTSEDFYLAYLNKYGEEPADLDALGYTAGLLIQYAYEKSGSIDPLILSQTIRNATIMTFYGAIGFEGSTKLPGGRTGLQVLHDPLLIEYVSTGGQLKKIIIWPEEYVTESYVPPS